MIYHVFANKSNIGDWLSAKGIQSALPDYKITELLCDAPFVDRTIDRLSSLQSGDFVIIGGGGLFMDYFVPFWQALSGMADQLSYGIWGVGYCDILLEASLPPSGLIEDVVRRSRFCYVRDELTREQLCRLHLPPPMGCPSFLCFPERAPPGRGLLHVDNYTTVGREAFEVMDQLARKFAADTGRSYRRTNNRIRGGVETELQRCIQLYREADIIVSSALHGCIIGVALGKRVVAVSGDRKIDSFMQSMALQNSVCANDELDKVPSLLEHVTEQPWPSRYIEDTCLTKQILGDLFEKMGPR